MLKNNFGTTSMHNSSSMTMTPHHYCLVEFMFQLILLFFSTIDSSFGWISSSSTSSIRIRQMQLQQHQRRRRILTAAAKRNRRGGSGSNDNNGGMNSWYDSVDDDATPDKVFWQEMERQRLYNQLGGNDNNGNNLDPVASISSMGGNTGGDSIGGGGGGGSISTPMMMDPSMSSSSTTTAGTTMSKTYTRKPPTLDEQKAADSTLSEYSSFTVNDNWLDEDLQSQMMASIEEPEEEELSIDEETQRLQEQLEALPDGYGDTRDPNYIWMDDEEEEIWDIWKRDQDTDASTRDLDRMGLRQVKAPQPDSEFYLGDDPPDPIEEENAEKEFWERMARCQISSRRLQKLNLSQSQAAKEFFQRPPNKFQGYDTMWVSAIDNVCFKSLKGNFRNYGVEFADNFGDWVDGQIEIDSLKYSIEDLASYKARLVYQATGLPCIASRSSFEIEPIPPTTQTTTSPAAGGGGGNPESAGAGGRGATFKGGFVSNNPKVMSGYKINDIAAHADYICDAMRPVSEPTRVTRYTSCLCYYDGTTEFFEHGVCDVDLHFSNSIRTLIPMAAAINNMVETCQYTFGLEFQSFAKKRYDDATIGGSSTTGGGSSSTEIGRASMKLRDRVLKDGKVLPNDIIDVSAFMDSQVDVDLMDECAKELAGRFLDAKPSKIMTVATTGLVLALPMAKYLQVPVVYARKERTVVMADTFQAGYSSKTVGKNRELLVSRSHVDASDRVLVVDDFLSSGASQEALLRIVNEAEATAVGVGVLLEKVYDSGRQSLSGFNIPIESLCRVASVQNGIIQLLEEDGFDMK